MNKQKFFTPPFNVALKVYSHLLGFQRCQTCQKTCSDSSNLLTKQTGERLKDTDITL